MEDLAKYIGGIIAFCGFVAIPLYKNCAKTDYSASSDYNSELYDGGSETSSRESPTIIVEHKREQIPVQEWRNCTQCFGSGRCSVCGGSGRLLSDYGDWMECAWCSGMRKCSGCAGKGGHYETVYR